MDEKKERISLETELYVSKELKEIRKIESKMGAIFSIENLSMNEIKAYIKGQNNEKTTCLFCALYSA